MFDLHCQVCDRRYLVDTSSLISLHNTSDGPVVHARCPHGHRNAVHFHARRPLVAGDVDRGTPRRTLGPAETEPHALVK